MYSSLVWKHMQRPQNRGVLQDANARGESRFPPCGDHFILQLRISDERIVGASFLAKACGPVIAVGSIGTGFLLGMSVAEARALSAFQIDQLVGGLPGPKRHAILLFLDSLNQAIESYFSEDPTHVNHSQ